MERIDGKSLDIVKDNIDKLKDIFPEVFSDDNVDFDRLKQLIGNYSEDKEERYSFTWNGKSKAIRLTQTPSMGTLRPVKAESKNWDKTQNLYIEGDNLEALKLLQKSYYKKVKIIFIDPPYNTGNDFVYKDDYKDNLNNYLEITRQLDEEGKKLGTNTDMIGRYHTNWLNMIYPRLKLARNILTDDGVIFISIDDKEVHNLRKVCDEIFGEDNFVASVAWKHTQQSKNDEKYFSRHYNHIVTYRKTNKLKEFRFRRTEQDNKNYSNSDNDMNGPWRSGDVRSPNYRKTLCFDIVSPSGKLIKAPTNGWRWSETSINEKIKSGEIIFNEDETKIIRKIYLKNQKGRMPENLWNGEEYGSTRGANTELKLLFDNNAPFDTPKPSALIMKMLELIHNENNFIVMDFFAGSSTTAEAVIKFNLEDGGNRKFIMVQLPEPCDEKSEAYKAGYKNICEIGKERIRRAGEKILEVNKDKEGIVNLDVGFKVFRLDSSNIKTWDVNFDNFETELEKMIDNIKKDRSNVDVVYEILLKYGLDLTLPAEEIKLADKTVYTFGFGALVICLDNDITLEVVEEIGKLKEIYDTEIMRVVFKDKGFKNDSVKVNAIQILKRYGIEDIKSI